MNKKAKSKLFFYNFYLFTLVEKILPICALDFQEQIVADPGGRSMIHHLQGRAETLSSIFILGFPVFSHFLHFWRRY